MTPAEGTTLDVCACGHTMASHDAVAIRYCAATDDHHRQRGCICKVAPPGDITKR